MSQLPTGVLPVTGGVVVAGTAFGIGWVAAAGAVCVVLGFALFRYSSRIRRRAQRS